MTSRNPPRTQHALQVHYDFTHLPDIIVEKPNSKIPGITDGNFGVTVGGHKRGKNRGDLLWKAKPYLITTLKHIRDESFNQEGEALAEQLVKGSAQFLEMYPSFFKLSSNL